MDQIRSGSRFEGQLRPVVSIALHGEDQRRNELDILESGFPGGRLTQSGVTGKTRDDPAFYGFTQLVSVRLRTVSVMPYTVEICLPHTRGVVQETVPESVASAKGCCRTGGEILVKRCRRFRCFRLSAFCLPGAFQVLDGT